VADAVARPRIGAGPGMTVAAASSGLTLAYDAVHYPELVGRWVQALLQSSLELAGQATVDGGRRVRSSFRRRSRSIM
jgi:hypothetical protein